MSQNWMRHFELVLVDDGGKGIVVSDFKTTFEIEQNDIKWPAIATVKVYNLSPHTSNRIMQREFSKMKIIAGYDGVAPDVKVSDVGIVRDVAPGREGQTNGMNYGVIFSGDIRFTWTGKDNATDSYVQIQACDSLECFLNATISTTLEKGYTLSDVYDLLMRRLEPYGISRGTVPEFPSTVFPRGKTFHGLVHVYLDNLAEQCGATWRFDKGILNIRTREMVSTSAILLNADTGLVGFPQQTIGGGVNVTCLINPNIQLNGLIQLDQAGLINRASFSASDIKEAGGPIVEQNINGNVSAIGKNSQTASIATDGVYVVRYITIRGDTRGQNWYMDMACEARGANDFKSSSALNKFTD